MKRLKFYAVSIVVLVLLSTAGYLAWPHVAGYPLADRIFTAYRLRVPPAHRVIDEPYYLNNALPTVVWEHSKRFERGTTVSIGLLHDPLGTPQEQGAMMAFLKATGNLDDNGPEVIVWFWIEYPNNRWHGVFCPPGPRAVCTPLEGTYILTDETWQELIVEPGWVRK